MKEEFLHNIWNYKKFEGINLISTQGKSISIIKTGQFLQQEGPDFFNAQLIIDGQKWAGNIEIHLKSSDWYLHKHEQDIAYASVILHVVWEHDVDVYNSDNQIVETLELKNIVPKTVINNYTKLFSKAKWISCENDLQNIDSFTLNNWLERLYIERLEEKSVLIEHVFKQTQNNWEATFFCIIAKTFGLNINGEHFLAMALSLPFSIIQKERFDLENLEALLFGTSGLLTEVREDIYYKNLQNRWEYMQHKHQIKQITFQKPQFFKLRPDNFPTVRLAQLASLLHAFDNLFSRLVLAKNSHALIEVFKSIQTSDYWFTHFTFDFEHPKKTKKLSPQFINLVLINAVIPMIFYYHNHQKLTDIERVISLIAAIPPEKNVVIERFSMCGINSNNAFDTQALLQLKRKYCEYQKCLHCAIGKKILYE